MIAAGKYFLEDEIHLALYVAFIVIAILAPCILIARYFEWRSWDNQRRIDRLRARRLR